MVQKYLSFPRSVYNTNSGFVNIGFGLETTITYPWGTGEMQFCRVIDIFGIKNLNELSYNILELGLNPSVILGEAYPNIEYFCAAK